MVNTDTQPEKPLPAFRSDLRFITHGEIDGIWYALEEPQSGRFLRFGRMEYLVANALNGKRTLSEVEAAIARAQPGEEFRREQICSVVTWIASQGLVSTPGPTSVPGAMVNGSSSASPIVDPFFIKVPLIPGPMVERLARACSFLFSLPMAVVSALLVTIAIIMVLRQPGEVFRIGNNLFVEDAQLWWLLAWFVLKIVHELGHAVSASLVGSQIRSAGIHFLFFAPVPYVDMTDLWGIANRWHRILCSAAGILFEAVIAAIALIVALSVTNESVQYIAAAIATLGTLTTFAFNANPLMKFDGYFILSDLLGRPKLWNEAQVALLKLVKTIIWPWRSHPGRFTWLLAIYGLLCFFYRILMLFTLAWWAMNVWQGVGVLMVGWAAYNWVIFPLLRRFRMARLQAKDPVEVAKYRREVVLGLATTVAGTAVLFSLPSPIHRAVPGIISFREPLVLRNDASGFLTEVLARDNQLIRSGDLIARLHNSNLAFELRLKQVQLQSAIERKRVLLARGELANSQAEQANVKSLEEQIVQLQARIQGLEIRATRDGTLVSPELRNALGQYFELGQPMGMIIDPTSLEVKGSTSQKDCPALLKAVGTNIQLTSSSGLVGSAYLEKVSTRGEDQLDEQALAAVHGGPLPVELVAQPDGSSALKLPQPRFAIHARIDPASSAMWVPGQIVKVSIPSERMTIGQLLHRWLSQWWDQFNRANSAT